jgi:DNA-binding transcriptional regulator Cro
MNYNDLIAHYGTEMMAAAKLGFSVTTIKNWQHVKIPRISQYAIQALSDGKLMADGEICKEKISQPYYAMPHGIQIDCNPASATFGKNISPFNHD